MTTRLQIAGGYRPPGSLPIVTKLGVADTLDETPDLSPSSRHRWAHPDALGVRVGVEVKSS